MLFLKRIAADPHRWIIVDAPNSDITLVNGYRGQNRYSFWSRDLNFT
jgi:hypothetical protein